METKTVRTYYISLRGEQAGPFTVDQMRVLRVRRNTLVWNEEKWSWTRAGRMEELAGLFAAAGQNAWLQKRAWWRPLAAFLERVVRALRIPRRSQIAR